MRNVTEDCCFSKTGLALYLSKSVRWVDYQLAGPFPPPGFKVRKSWIFKKSEIDAWLEQFRAGAELDKIVDEVVAEVAGG